MADTFTTAKRRQIMTAVKSSGTGPERIFAETLRAAGIPARGNVLELPGSPDFVIEEAKIAIFIHGCFWHGHGCERGSRIPQTNTDYWIGKIRRNVRRDRRSSRELRKLGYAVITVWECRLKPSWLPPRLIRAIRVRGGSGLAGERR